MTLLYRVETGRPGREGLVCWKQTVPHRQASDDASSFQVMPQLLNYLKADRLGRSVDWGVLAVFTCAESCGLGAGYTEEFVWKQDLLDTA